MESKTIWYISKYAAPNKYGLGTRHFYLAKEWINLGHKVIVVTGNASHKRKELPKFSGMFFREEIETVPTVWINSFKYYEGKSWKRVLSWFLFELSLLFFPRKKDGRPDIVIVSSLSLLTVWGGLWFKLRYGCKFIFEVRDIWPLSLLVLSNTKATHPFVRFLSVTEKIGYKKANVIVGTMPNLQSHVENVIPEAAHKVYCIPQCYDPSFVASGQGLIPDEVVVKVLNTDRLKVCYAGALNTNNPLDLLLDVAKSTPECEVYILGKGVDRERLMLKYEDCENIIFLPFISKEKVVPTLELFDIAYDSIDSALGEFGLSRNKWIDYMLAGKPIICAFSGYPSMINEANSGTFVNPDFDQLKDAIMHYVNLDSEQLKAEGMRAKEWITDRRSARAVATDFLKLM